MDAWTTPNANLSMPSHDHQHTNGRTSQPLSTEGGKGNELQNGDLPQDNEAADCYCCGMTRRPAWCPTFNNKKWEVFGQTTTLHGMRFVSNTKNHWLRRCIWMSLVISLIAILFFVVGFNVVRFFTFPISSVVTLKYTENLKFPAVTLCNYNQWRKSVVQSDNAKDLSKFFFPTLRGNDTFDLRDYNVSNLNLTAEVLRGAHQKENMIVDCAWKTVEKCSYKNFTQIITDFGVCYTFNNPIDPSKALSVRQTGSDHGLFLRLNLELYDYFYGERKGAGFKIMVHAQGEIPFVKQLGFSVAPGSESLVGLQYTKLINLPYPYETKCINDEWLTSFKYTVETCQSLCAVNYTVRYCGCKSYSMPGPFRVCNAVELFDCVKPIQEQFIQKNPQCDCPVPCRRELYQPRISEVTWPAPHIAEQLSKAFNKSEDFIRRNFMDLVIYFEELNYEEIRQVPAYEWTTLLSDIGGYMGLLIGASTITVLEFVDFAIANAIHAIQKKRAVHVQEKNTTDSSMELV